jgi:hypothetical protein
MKNVLTFDWTKKKPGAKFDPLIIVKFTNKLDKFVYFGKYFAKKDLKLTDIGFQVGSRIFINENLVLNLYTTLLFSPQIQNKKDSLSRI